MRCASSFVAERSSPILRKRLTIGVVDGVAGGFGSAESRDLFCLAGRLYSRCK